MHLHRQPTDYWAISPMVACGIPVILHACKWNDCPVSTGNKYCANRIIYSVMQWPIFMNLSINDHHLWVILWKLTDHTVGTSCTLAQGCKTMYLTASCVPGTFLSRVIGFLSSNATKLFSDSLASYILTDIQVSEWLSWDSSLFQTCRIGLRFYELCFQELGKYLKSSIADHS